MTRESPRLFLDQAYQKLGYDRGVLLEAVDHPVSDTDEAVEWLEKGDWLALAKRVNASKVFFVRNDPVVVFHEFPDWPSESILLDVFRQTWCMARPQCLFMALPGELRVYSLNTAPARNLEDWKRIEPLEVVYRAVHVAEQLRDYNRDQIESGSLFERVNFGDIDNRADRRLIEDLRTVRRALLEADHLDQRYAHSLIGRSIFIRYLEDRGILTPKYFERIASQNRAWEEVLSEPPEKAYFSLNSDKRRYDRVLRNKDFTYALFEQLADHFNGDMFPRDEDEKLAVNQEHLNLLRGFLLGDTDAGQPTLFFWAYDFDIIPIELISSIYEEFYHDNSKSVDEGTHYTSAGPRARLPKRHSKSVDDKGTHYTPSVLVDYVLSQTLTSDRLATRPRILDPACGSGIFLVEAFRRIIRYESQKAGRPLSSNELRAILRSQITGIEINREAIHVAAFSLYLALLHYQEPPDILAQMETSNHGSKPLPPLIVESDSLQLDESHHNALFHANTFGLLDSERKALGDKLARARFLGRAEVSKLHSSSMRLPMDPHTFDIIVGNPPWGFKEGRTPQIREDQDQAQRWCDVFDWTIGDKEFSQAFVARSLSLLKPGGECALLVSTGVFLNPNNQKFRRRWLDESTLKTVVNFAHVRDVFFSSATAPFAFVQFEAGPPSPRHRIAYWSAKKTRVVDKVKSVILSHSDLRQLKQEEVSRNEYLWKVYWWGGHRDAALISLLNTESSLEHLIKERGWTPPGQGYTPGSIKPSGWLSEFKELPIKHFGRYGRITEDALIDVPSKVHRKGIRDVYSGWRLLIKRGITQAHGANGRIEARLEDQTYCFRNSIHAIRLDDAKEWERKVLIGILWSSLARYYFFTTASSWGPWHHEIHLGKLIELPVRLPSDSRSRERIVRLVDRLTDHGRTPNPHELERRLDEAIFDLYELNEGERDLILDMCEIGLEFFYKRDASDAVRGVDIYPVCSQGRQSDLPRDRTRERGLEGYLHAFLDIWNRELRPKGEFSWRVIRPSNIPMIAVVFTVPQNNSLVEELPIAARDEWSSVLQKCEEVISQPVSKRIYIDGMIRVVSDTDIVVIRRDERRLWTRSTACEDAEASLVQAIQLQRVAEHFPIESTSHLSTKILA